MFMLEWAACLKCPILDYRTTGVRGLMSGVREILVELIV